MTAKEKPLCDILPLDTPDVRVEGISDEAAERTGVGYLPVGWGQTLTGEQMPNAAEAVRRSRDSH